MFKGIGEEPSDSCLVTKPIRLSVLRLLTNTETLVQERYHASTKASTSDGTIQPFANQSYRFGFSVSTLKAV